MVSTTARGGAKFILTKRGQRAACCPISPSNDFHFHTYPSSYRCLTPSRENPERGEGATSKWRATEDRCPEHWKPPDLHIEVLEPSGGA